MLKDLVKDALAHALTKLAVADTPIEISATDKPEYGDYATNVAFLLSKPLKKSPRQIAEELLPLIPVDSFDNIEVAGPGFLNFHLKLSALQSVVHAALKQKNQFGKPALGQAKKIQVEYVSANPTGPLTVGHARNAVVGDTVANLLGAVGYHVTREYYFNNAGRQMRILGESVKLRSRELLGESVDIPEDYYQGNYLVEIAQTILDQHGNSAIDQDWVFFKDIAEQAIFADIRHTLLQLGIEFDVFMNEADFFEDNSVWAVLERLREKGMVYDQDGAVWYKATKFGAEKDRVFVRSSGEPTYRLPDIAYHVNKLDRGFERIINVLGADHAAQTPDIKSAVSVLGYDPDRIEPLIYQFVTLTSGGEAVKMSTRKANFVTLDELVAEVGADAVRYFMISRSTDAQMEFDLALAKSQSKDNPVYYIQYAHTRIASILRELAPTNETESSSDLSALREPDVLALIKKLDAFEDALTEATRHLAPHIVATYAHQLAALFHTFYEKHRVLVDDPAVSQARLALVKATQIVLKSSLAILGVSAPETM